MGQTQLIEQMKREQLMRKLWETFIEIRYKIADERCKRLDTREG